MTKGRSRRGRGLSPLKWAVISAILVFLAFFVVILEGPGFPANLFAPTYDGWKVDGLDTCPEPDFDPSAGQPTAWDCGATLALWLKTAGDGFDRRDPGHAPVVRATLHYYGGNAKFLSNTCEVAVLELADGTVRAIGVGHVGVLYDHLATCDHGPDN
jgi:hypothetical protein